MKTQQKRSKDYQRSLVEKQQRDQRKEDKDMAEYYETQNRIMKAHMEYHKLSKDYSKFMKNKWAPFIKEKQEEQRKRREEATKHKNGVNEYPLHPDSVTDVDGAK